MVTPFISVRFEIDLTKRHECRYKRPRKVERRETLPKSNVGKILRRAPRG